MYARTQQNTQILLYRGSYSPTVGSKVGLHKGFDAHKAPDTPPGRVDDVIGGFQIIPALVGNQGITEPSGLDGVQAVLLAPHFVDLIQLFRAGAGIRLQANVTLGFEEIEHIVVVPLHQFPVALGTVTLGELKAILHQPLQALKCPQQDALDLCSHLLGNVRVVHTGQGLVLGGQNELAAVETV